MLLYTFDNTESFPILESLSTARGRIGLRAVETGPTRTLRLSFHRSADDRGDVVIVLALPLRAIEGAPSEFLLDLLGDASGCRPWIGGADARGEVWEFGFGPVGFMGTGTVRAGMTSAKSANIEESTGESASRESADRERRVALPLQLHRLGMNVPSDVGEISLQLCAMRVPGNASLVPVGMA